MRPSTRATAATMPGSGRAPCRSAMTAATGSSSQPGGCPQVLTTTPYALLGLGHLAGATPLGAEWPFAEPHCPLPRTSSTLTTVWTSSRHFCFRDNGVRRVETPGDPSDPQTGRRVRSRTLIVRGLLISPRHWHRFAAESAQDRTSASVLSAPAARGRGPRPTASCSPRGARKHVM